MLLHGARDRWVDENDDEVSYRTRFAGDSDEARELQNIRYDEELSNLDIVKDDYYYDDEDVEYMEEDIYASPRTVDEGDEEPVGNFWSNPKPGFDPMPSKRRKSSIIREQDAESMSEIESTSERRPRPRPKGAPRRKYVVILDFTNSVTMIFC